MELILREDIETLGKRGTTVKVKDGYARNFLLPRRLAVAATETNRRQLEAELKRRAVEEATSRQDAEVMRDRLALESVTIAVKVGPEDRLYGSVTAEDVARALKQAGFAIVKQQVILKESVKTLGEYEVALRVHHDVPMAARVRVVKA